MEYLLVGFFIGALSCLVSLYWLGTRRHKSHPKSQTGPSSKMHAAENIVALTKKG